MTTAQRPWLTAYPDGVPADLDESDLNSTLIELFESAFRKYPQLVAHHFMGRDLTYAQWDADSRALAAAMQAKGLKPGDRVALMLPNVLQFPMAAAAIIRAGLVVVNVNPLYTARELEHQLKDSGAKAIFILENFAHVLQACKAKTQVEQVYLCAMGDTLPGLKGALVNFVVRKVKKLVPAFSLPGAIRFNDLLAQGQAANFQRVDARPDDVAVLQYTGGTTGVSKGATLLHRNLAANAAQSELWNAPVMHRLPKGEQFTLVCALPLYHIFAFTVGMVKQLRSGDKLLLIPNPRDLPATLKTLSQHRFHGFPAVNTLFNAIVHHPDFNKVDWSHLLLSLGGGMAVQSGTAKLWLEKTGCPICEGYGLSETSPSTSCNPTNSTEFTGNIGVPIPSTWMKVVDDDGRDVAVGEVGELCIKGPQVMAGYWQRPDETAKVMLEGGWFRSGDVGFMDEQGFFKIVDRKKDMILVSGFNVYPNEIEDVVSTLPGVLECAAVGIPDEQTTEGVCLFVVKSDPNLSEEAIRKHCRENLTAYKNPKKIVFRTELPKTTVGKILRRSLRDEVNAKA